MTYKILADIVVLLHFLWIVFLIFGGFAGARNKVVRAIHCLGLVFALVIQFFDWYCPLTHLEVWLRARHDPLIGYSGSFIIYYVEKIVYLDISRYLIMVLTVVVFGINIWAYFFRKRRA
jgi:hypothetical protein